MITPLLHVGVLLTWALTVGAAAACCLRGSFRPHRAAQPDRPISELIAGLPEVDRMWIEAHMRLARRDGPEPVCTEHTHYLATTYHRTVCGREILTPAERRVAALRLRRDGATFKAIADQLRPLTDLNRYDSTTAAQDVLRETRRTDGGRHRARVQCRCARCWETDARPKHHVVYGQGGMIVSHHHDCGVLTDPPCNDCRTHVLGAQQ